MKPQLENQEECGLRHCKQLIEVIIQLVNTLDFMTEEQRRAVEYEEEEKEKAAKTDFHKS